MFVLSSLLSVFTLNFFKFVFHVSFIFRPTPRATRATGGGSKTSLVEQSSPSRIFFTPERTETGDSFKTDGSGSRRRTDNFDPIYVARSDDPQRVPLPMIHNGCRSRTLIIPLAPVALQPNKTIVFHTAQSTEKWNEVLKAADTERGVVVYADQYKDDCCLFRLLA
jgi:hypothetical protein